MEAQTVPFDILVAASFYFLSALAIAGAAGVVLARRIFHSALFLVATLASVAGVFVVLGADFLAGVQVLVYVGAVMVLILFGIMLTPQSTVVPNTVSRGQAMASGMVAAAFLVATLVILLGASWPGGNGPRADSPTTATIGFSLFSTYMLPFELASLLLLVAMVGAIVIARED